MKRTQCTPAMHGLDVTIVFWLVASDVVDEEVQWEQAAASCVQPCVYPACVVEPLSGLTSGWALLEWASL